MALVYVGSSTLMDSMPFSFRTKISGLSNCCLNFCKSDFDKLVKGQSLDEVRAIDPNGEYLFLYTGRNDAPKVSSHYTKDGYLITIEYDVSNVITSINEELI